MFDGVINLLTQEAIESLQQEPSPQLGLFDPRDAAIEPNSGNAVIAAEIVAPHTRPPDSGLAPAAAIVLEADHATQNSSNKGAPSSEAASTALPNAELPSAEQALATRVARPAPASRRPPVAEPVPEFLQERPQRSFTAVWSLFALIALLAMAAQVVMHLRTEIAVLVPQARFHLETACEMLGCVLRLPRRAELMSIESSDLQADTRRPGVIVLNALLRNRAPFEQEYPDLELTLTDERDLPVIRKVLDPSDYLQERRAAGVRGIGAGAEEAVRVHFDTGRLRATGYRLYLFYR